MLVDAGTKNPPLVFNTYIFNEYGFYRNKYLKLMVSSLHARPKTHAIAHLVWNWNGTYSLKIEPPKHSLQRRTVWRNDHYFSISLNKQKAIIEIPAIAAKMARPWKNLANALRNIPRVSAALFLSANGSCSHLYYVIFSIFLPVFQWLTHQQVKQYLKATSYLMAIRDQI